MRGAVLLIGSAPVTHPPTILDALRIVVRPVDQAAEVVPFVHAAHDDAIPEPDRDALGKIDVVRDQQGLAIADVDDETLVTRTIVVITQQAADEACDLDPPPVIAFVEFYASSPLPEPS